MFPGTTNPRYVSFQPHLMRHSEREREDSIDNKTKDKKFASGLFVDTGVEHSKLCGKRNERYRLVFAAGV